MRSLSVKFLCNLCKKLSYIQVLRAYVFTFSALDAVTCLAALCGVKGIVICGIPIFKMLLAVKTSEKVGNADTCRATVGAVSTSGAGDKIF